MRKAPGKDVTMHTSRSGPWRVQHHGSRPFGTREEVATYKLSKSIEILWLKTVIMT
jgi:predicted alpha/beta-hydrolase family hydrolase